MKKILYISVIVILAMSLAMVANAQKNKFKKNIKTLSGKIVIAGTGDSQELLRALADRFNKIYPDTTIEVPDSIGSGGGIKAAGKGRVDLGRVARPIKEKEKKYGLTYKLFARSPVVFVVNPSVAGVDNLTAEQIIGIYSGKIIYWSDLGGEKKKIYIANREKGDSSRSVLEKNLSGFKDITTFAGKVIYNTPETAQTIVKHGNTIGYLPLDIVRKTD